MLQAKDEGPTVLQAEDEGPTVLQVKGVDPTVLQTKDVDPTYLGSNILLASVLPPPPPRCLRNLQVLPPGLGDMSKGDNGASCQDIVAF